MLSAVVSVSNRLQRGIPTVVDAPYWITLFLLADFLQIILPNATLLPCFCNHSGRYGRCFEESQRWGARAPVPIEGNEACWSASAYCDEGLALFGHSIAGGFRCIFFSDFLGGESHEILSLYYSQFTSRLGTQSGHPKIELVIRRILFV